MTKKQFVNSKGDTWEWEETPETKEALKKMWKHIAELELKAPDYGEGK